MDITDVRPGAVIEHALVPGFHMTVLDAKLCEVDSGRPAQHKKYKVTDPGGNEDWLCAYDVREIRER